MRYKKPDSCYLEGSVPRALVTRYLLVEVRKLKVIPSPLDVVKVIMQVQTLKSEVRVDVHAAERSRTRPPTQQSLRGVDAKKSRPNSNHHCRILLRILKAANVSEVTRLWDL